MLNFNKKIRAIRELHHLKQEELADLIPISVRTLQRIEKEESSPSLEIAERIAEVLGHSLEDILHFDLETNQFVPYAHEKRIDQLEKENADMKAQVFFFQEAYYNMIRVMHNIMDRVGNRIKNL